jgi:hypothetical protein
MTVGSRQHVRAFLVVFAVWSVVPTVGTDAADLHSRTLAAFDRYVQVTESRLDREIRGDSPFLWLNRLGETQRRDALARLERGEVVVSRLETRDDEKRISVPDGLCHHWVGTVFVADAGLDRIAALMQAYDEYAEIYRPNVRRGKTLSRNGDHFVVYLQLFMKKVISVVLNSEYDVRYVSVAPNRMHVRSYATRIAEVDQPDTPQEHEKPIGHDSGFLWRFNNYCALEELDGGIYVQCETISLSRDVPFGLGWLIGPFVTGIPKDSLEFTLTAIQKAATAPR